MAKDTKERILAAALEQFSQNGYAETEEINIAKSITKIGVYAYR